MERGGKMRPIDADDLVQKIYEHAWVADNIFIDELVDGIIGNMETIEERPQGKWIKDDFTGLIKCSRCKNDAPISTVSGEQYESDFCQSCGADMREPKDGEK
jgi:hypothetical protein